VLRTGDVDSDDGEDTEDEELETVHVVDLAWGVIIQDS
jgi:hypothetical protein